MAGNRAKQLRAGIDRPAQGLVCNTYPGQSHRASPLPLSREGVAQSRPIGADGHEIELI